IASASVDVSTPVVDISALAEQGRAEQINRIVVADRGRRFDLAQQPLIRTTLLRTSPRAHVLIVTSHHIASDAWSIGVFMRELSALYRSFVAGAPSQLPGLTIQYADHALSERDRARAGVWDAQISHWKKQLADPPAALPLPVDRRSGRADSS